MLLYTTNMTIVQYPYIRQFLLSAPLSELLGAKCGYLLEVRRNQAKHGPADGEKIMPGPVVKEYHSTMFREIKTRSCIVWSINGRPIDVRRL